VSTTESGDRFRDEVAALLRAGGYSVETEILEGHKRVDIVFEQINFGKRHRYVVEAKNWSVPLNKTDLEAIYGGYCALINSRAADELLIVSPHALRSPAAKAFIRDTPKISHLSFNEFQESILGFHHYLQKFTIQHERDGLEDYYVSPVIEGNVRLESRIDDWLENDEKCPIAIIASYGMGKTSFAHHITYKLAKRHLSGGACRLPILVSLGTISREQSLEGLIGAVLAGSHPTVHGYKFPLFAHLNAIGRFVVLLDGFDEMKHMMTHAEFIANFDELNKLVDGAAKVLILGRPTAFLSDNERLSVLRGSRPIGNMRVRAPGMPNYTEVELLPFSGSQLKDFVRAYLTRHQRLGNIEITDELMRKRQLEIQEKVNEDLISRPIHARMMADLATDTDFDLGILSRFALYDHFVNHLIERELKKSGRGKLHKAHDRRSFACDLAWYLWTEHRSSGLGCRIDELPDALFVPYVPEGEELNSVKRDLLSGSFLDEKKGGVFFFSHRSFQEFLVSEYIWSAVTADYDATFVYVMINSLTSEVFEFLLERADESFFRDLFAALAHCKDGIPSSTFDLFCMSGIMRDIAGKRSGALFSSWDAAIQIGGAMRGPSDNLRSEDMVRLAKIISGKAEKKPLVILSALNTFLTLGLQYGLHVNTIASALIVLLFARPEADLAKLSVPTVGRSRNDILRDIIFEVVSADKGVGVDGLFMRLHLPQLFVSLSSATSIPVWHGERDLGNDESGVPKLSVYEAPFEEFFKDLSASGQRAVRTFFERDAAAAQAIRRQKPTRAG
jgi:hypothetical protein